MSDQKQIMRASRFSRRSLLVGGGAALVGLSMPSATRAAFVHSHDKYANVDWLVDAAWVKQRLGDPSLKVVAFTPIDAYEAGHIPGATQIDWPDLALAETSDPSIASWHAGVQTILARLNVTPGDTVVLYDDATLLAARLWWVLDLLGHGDIRMLNGGLGAWKLAGGELETGSASSAAAEPYPGEVDRAKLATLDDVAKSLDARSLALIDARNADEYGAGHIPGAINHAFPLNAEDGPVRVWKSADLLGAVYAGMGITPDREIVSYCATGVRSSVTYFTLRLLGYPNVRVYTGSWNEWSARPELPVATA